jgi:hypothetical protein
MEGFGRQYLHDAVQGWEPFLAEHSRFGVYECPPEHWTTFRLSDAAWKRTPLSVDPRSGCALLLAERMAPP